MRRKKNYKVCLLLLLVLTTACKHRKQERPMTIAESRAYKENLEKANRGLLNMDEDRIEAYVKRRGWQMEKTQTGLWYEIYEKGSGQQAEKGQMARLDYSVYLLDGTLCYTSDSLGSMQVRISQSSIETGLDQAILMMREGDKGRFIMPPHLAHGLLGDDAKIPPRSIIVYHAELLKLTDY